MQCSPKHLWCLVSFKQRPLEAVAALLLFLRHTNVILVCFLSYRDGRKSFTFGDEGAHDPLSSIVRTYVT